MTDPTHAEWCHTLTGCIEADHCTCEMDVWHVTAAEAEQIARLLDEDSPESIAAEEKLRALFARVDPT